MLVVLVVVDWLPGSKVVYRRLRVRSSGADVAQVSDQVCAVLKANRVRIQDLTGRLSDAVGDGCELILYVRCRNTVRTPALLGELSDLDGGDAVDWSPLHEPD